MANNGDDTFDKNSADVQKLAVKWVRGKVTTRQLQEEYGNKAVTLTLYRAAVALREAFKAGLFR